MTDSYLKTQPLLELSSLCELLATQAEVVHHNGPEGLLGTHETPIDRLTETLAKTTALLGYLVSANYIDAGTLERLTVAYAEDISREVNA